MMVKVVKFIIKSLIVIFILIIFRILISFVTYKDTTNHIKPLALELSKNSKILKNGLLSKDEVLNLLKESGCVKTSNEKIEKFGSFEFLTTNCTISSDESLYISFTSSKSFPPSFDIIFENSHCTDYGRTKVECYTNSIMPLPSR